MNTLWKSLVKRLREYLYLLVTFPVALILFVIVMAATSSNIFLPLGILLMLGLLTFMQWVAAFEVKRTNRLLKTDFAVVDNWFSKPFFSWDGAKERVTSLRSWMAIVYIFIAFGWSIFSFVLVVVGISGLLAILTVAGVLAMSTINKSFVIIDDGDRFTGSISTFPNSHVIRLDFGNAPDSAVISWNLSSYWSMGLAAVIFIAVLWLIPRNARVMAKMVEGFLSGAFLPEIQSRLSQLRSSKKVSERDVREAMDKEVLQPQLSELSAREREILGLMAQGKSNAGIARSLYITEGSVEKHISSILSKLDLPVEEESHRRVLAVLKYLGIDG